MAALLYLSVFPFGVGGLDVDLIVSVPEFSYLLFIVCVYSCRSEELATSQIKTVNTPE